MQYVLGSPRRGGRGALQLLPGRLPILLDGPTNPEGAEVLAAHLAEQIAGGRSSAGLLFGAMKDKDVPGSSDRSRAFVDRAVAVTPPVDGGWARRSWLPSLSRRGAFREAAATPAEGPDAREASRGRTGMVLVAGSLYLVGAVLALIEGRDARGRSRCNNAEPMPTKIASASPLRLDPDEAVERLDWPAAFGRTGAWKWRSGSARDDSSWPRGAPPGGAPLRIEWSNEYLRIRRIAAERQV